MKNLVSTFSFYTLFFCILRILVIFLISALHYAYNKLKNKICCHGHHLITTLKRPTRFKNLVPFSSVLESLTFS